MKFLDIRYSDDCPNCGQNLYHFIWDKDNVLSVSGSSIILIISDSHLTEIYIINVLIVAVSFILLLVQKIVYFKN